MAYILREISSSPSLEALSRVYEKNTPTIIGARIQGTSDRVRQENTFRCELALSILSVLLNMTYETSFNRLWQLRRVHRPEQGLSKQVSFSLIDRGKCESAKELGFSTKLAEQWFPIDEKVIGRWHNYLALNALNRVVCQGPSQ